jgi:hypothetical protein
MARQIDPSDLAKALKGERQLSEVATSDPMRKFRDAATKQKTPDNAGAFLR